MTRRRILFVGEGVTLAHVTRPYLLARSLPATQYEAVLAIPDGYASLLDLEGIAVEHLSTVTPARFLDALSKGRPLYDYVTLCGYVADDLALIERVRPDLVVGDFRLSLAVSAPLAGVPYAALTNAHWSPYAAYRGLPIPEHVSTRLLGVAASQWLFDLARPVILAAHARPLNRLRKHHGMRPLGGLREVYCHGDHTLYLDTPGLIPTTRLPATHHYLGPAVWSPAMALPDWWDRLDTARPVVYVTLGSSGQVAVLPAVVNALQDLGVTSLVATAGRSWPDKLAADASTYCADYLPGSAAAARAALVVCNGGSATVYQALAQGCPVLGIPSNLDQHLTMHYVSRAGAGLTLRSERARSSTVRACIETLLRQPGYGQHARRIAREFAQYDCATRFLHWLHHHAWPG